jgi:hypothetical protein
MTKKGYCHDCEKNTKLEREPIPALCYVGYILATLFFHWAFVFMWLLHEWVQTKTWKCAECGSGAVHDPLDADGDMVDQAGRKHYKSFQFRWW